MSSVTATVTVIAITCTVHGFFHDWELPLRIASCHTLLLWIIFSPFHAVPWLILLNYNFMQAYGLLLVMII